MARRASLGDQILGLISIGALFLYYLLMKWLICNVVPDFLLICALLGMATIPIVYARKSFRIFGPKTRIGQYFGYFALTAVGALLFWIYCDLAYLAARGINLFISPLAGSIVVEYSGYLMRTWPAWPMLASWSTAAFGLHPESYEDVMMLVLISTTSKGLFFAPLLLITRGLSSEAKSAEQPARLQYFFSQAFIDLGAAVGQTGKEIVRIGQRIFMTTIRITAGPQGLLIWPLSIAVIIALIPLSIGAMTVLMILLALHGTSVLVLTCVNLYLSTMLYLTERAVMLVRSGYAKCPHAGCHQPIPLPTFLCPSCGARHTRLIPGRCGVLRRFCACGRASLPCLFWLGKGRLPSLCPHCRNPLRGEIFLGNMHVPIYGGPSAGKTMLMMAATYQLLERTVPGVHASLIRKPDQESYAKTWRPQFHMGQVREKTTQLWPDAFLLAMSRPSGQPLSLYMYDPDGHAMASETNLRGHRFLRYMDGLALVLDPLSLPETAERYRDRAGELPTRTTSSADPVEVLNRIVSELEHQGVLSRKQKCSRRVAVIISKVDLPMIQDELGLSSQDTPPKEPWRDIGITESAMLRDWIRQQHPHLLQMLETRFSNLRFFGVSALGHAPDGRPFAPRQVLAPLFWLLSRRPALVHPRLARYVTKLAEVIAILTIVSLFITLPALALRLLWS